MARLSLSKQQLAKERSNLAMYRRYLPSLDLKRKQLMSERANVETRIADLGEQIARETRRVGTDVPMLAFDGLDLTGLVKLTHIELGERNVVGARLPVVKDIHVTVAPYGLLTRPHWLDLVVHRARLVLRLEAERANAHRQLELLDEAVRKVTQKVNLFEKVLIPRTRDNIKRIGIALGDRERAAVVTSKIAKRKREEEEAAV